MLVDEHPAYFTLTQAAIALGISRQRVHQLVMDGKLAALSTHVGRLVPRASIEAERARRKTPAVRAAIEAARAGRQALIEAELARLTPADAA
jgi:hypothetical protein